MGRAEFWILNSEQSCHKSAACWQIKGKARTAANPALNRPPACSYQIYRDSNWYKKSYKYLLTAFTSKVQWHSDLKETQICITGMEIFPPEEVWMLSQWSMPRRVPASHRKPRNLWLVKPFSDKILSTLVYLLIGKRQTEPDSKIYISPRSPNRRIILDTGGHGTATIRENRWLPFHQWEFNETLPDRNRKQK